MTNNPKRTGRPIKVGKLGQRVSLGLKVTGKLKNRIDGAAKESGRTQSQEAELRLEQSFAQEDELGGPEIKNIARLMAAAFVRGGQRGAHARKHPKWTATEWINDPFCYQTAVAAVGDALSAAQPVKYQSKNPDPKQQVLHTKIHSQFAQAVARGAEVTVTHGDEKEAEK